MKKLIVILLICFIYSSVYGEVYWQDNFNGFTSGWTPSIGGDNNKLYPWTTDETFDPEDPSDDGGGSRITNYEPSTYAANLRTNSNSWNGWVEYPDTTGTISIITTGGVDNSPCLRLRLVKHNDLSNEVGLNKWLGNTHYQELYITYKVKFGSTGEDFWWGGAWSGGDPTAGNIIYKQGRVWTGVNLTDYDKTGGQSQPVTNTTFTYEENWRCGIWIFKWHATDWNTVGNSAYAAIENFYFPPSCTGSGECDSTSPDRTSSGNVWDWAYTTTSKGRVNVFANSSNDFDSDGSFSETQVFHTVTMYLKNNSSPSATDGDLRMWVDGTEITSEVNISPPILASMSADPDDYGMNFVRFGDNFRNLTEAIPTSPGYMDIYIDDIIIASTLAEAQGESTSTAGRCNLGSGTTVNINTGTTVNILP